MIPDHWSPFKHLPQSDKGYWKRLWSAVRARVRAGVPMDETMRRSHGWQQATVVKRRR